MKQNVYTKLIDIIISFSNQSNQKMLLTNSLINKNYIEKGNSLPTNKLIY